MSVSYDLNVKLAFPHDLRANNPEEGGNVVGPNNIVDLIRYVNLELETLESVVHWNGLTARDFETAHGLTRLVKIVPDKLATALLVNREMIPDPEHDGSQLLDLVDRLLANYLDLNEIKPRKVVPDEATHFIRSVRFGMPRDPWPSRAFDGKKFVSVSKILEEVDVYDKNLASRRARFSGIPDSIRRVRSLIEKAKEALLYHDEASYREIANRILTACHDLRLLAETYCRMVHPILYDANRKNYYSEEEANSKAEQTTCQLAQMPDLHKEFLRILSG